LSIRPEDVEIVDRGAGENVVAAEVDFVRDLGFEVETYLHVGEYRIKAKWMPKEDPSIAEGDTVHLLFDPADIRVHLS
jgi:ABC-type Fe3+/spermidine/putrescine transport system ATPase subunit